MHQFFDIPKILYLNLFLVSFYSINVISNFNIYDLLSRNRMFLKYVDSLFLKNCLFNAGHLLIDYFFFDKTVIRFDLDLNTFDIKF